MTCLKSRCKRFWFIVTMSTLGFCLCSALTLAYAAPKMPAETERIDAEAMDILQRMAQNIASAEQFSVTIRSNYDAPQADGQMIEFGALRDIQVLRPDNMRVDLKRSDGEERTLLLGNDQIVLINHSEEAFSKKRHVAGLDEMITYLVSVLDIPLPLAKLFRSTLPSDFTSSIKEIAYVEHDVLTPVPTHQLAVRTGAVDFQVWVDMSDNPLPQRIIITYKNESQAPQFRADFSSWDLSAKAAKGPFDFVQPEGMEEIPLLVPQIKDTVKGI